MRDEHGEPIDNNAALRVVLEYGALRVLTHTFLECLPEEVIDEIKEEGRAGLVAEQRQKFRVENMDEWILVNKLLKTLDTWNAVRKLVPSHVMSSLSEVTREATSQMWQYGHRVRWMRTHSGERICRLRELQQPGLGPPQLLLPTVMMTDLYPTDEEQRANKPAGMVMPRDRRPLRRRRVLGRP